MALDMKRIETGENLTTEFKREYTDEIKKTVVAFAISSSRYLIPQFKFVPPQKSESTFFS